MNYYKLINGTTFVGVATQHDFRVFQHKHNIILACTEEQAQYVQCSNSFYRANWMVPVTTDKFAYEIVDIIRIDKDEYDILYEAVENGDEIEVEQEQVIPEEPPIIDPNEETTIDYVKSSKITTLSNTCNTVITHGIDVQLSDGNTYHFSLTTQDQLNLITLSTLIAAGQTEIPYHADGELCRYYSVEDITIITETATAHKTYHVTYFNSLKAWVNAMDSIDDIATVQYGTTIPEEYQSDILKEMLLQMAGGSV